MSEYSVAIHESGWMSAVAVLVTGDLSILTTYLFRQWPDAAERAAERRHRETMVRAILDDLRDEKDVDFLVLEPYLQYAREKEEKQRKLGKTSKSVFGGAFSALAGGGDPAAVKEDGEEEEESEADAERGSIQQTPAFHRARSPRRRSESPVRKAESPLQIRRVAPHMPLDYEVSAPGDLRREVIQALSGGFSPSR
jgi:hypothetical protein